MILRREKGANYYCSNEMNESHKHVELKKTDTKYYMIPLISMLIGIRSVVASGGRDWLGRDTLVRKGIFWGLVSVLYFDKGMGYMDESVCQN